MRISDWSSDVCPSDLLGVVAIASQVFIESCTADGVRRAAATWAESDLPRRLARYHGDKAESVFRGWAETWLRPSFRRWQMTDRLPAIACPTLIVQGEIGRASCRERGCQDV